MCLPFTAPKHLDSLRVSDRKPTKFENSTKRMIALYLEPWGADYWLALGDIFDVVPQDPGADYYLHVIHHDDAIQVYVEGSGSAVVVQNGRELVCGHQRPNDA